MTEQHQFISSSEHCTALGGNQAERTVIRREKQTSLACIYPQARQDSAQYGICPLAFTVMSRIYATTRRRDHAFLMRFAVVARASEKRCSPGTSSNSSAVTYDHACSFEMNLRNKA